MRTTNKELLHRFRGVMIGPIGANWEPPELEIQKARRIIAFCEDRRILFAPHNWEMRDEAVDSAIKIRDSLTKELGNIDRQSELAKNIETIRKACRTFLDELRQYEIEHGKHEYNMVQGPPRDALDNLRKTCARCLLWIAIQFKLDVEEELVKCFEYATDN